jgi:hypothetical protein
MRTSTSPSAGGASSKPMEQGAGWSFGGHRLDPFRTRSGEAVVPTRQSLRTSQLDRHLQQAVRPLGRSLRRRGRRRSHDRLAHLPRRSPLPPRRLQPTQRPRPRNQHGQRRPVTNHGVKFTCRQGVNFRLPLTQNPDCVYSSLCDAAGYPVGWEVVGLNESCLVGYLSAIDVRKPPGRQGGCTTCRSSILPPNRS